MRIAILLLMFFAAAPLSHAAQWSDWRWVNPLPQGNTLLDAATGNDTTVIVGGGSILVRTTGQEDWDLADADLDSGLSSVVWTGERFVAVGGSYSASIGQIRGASVVTSTDGRNWVKAIDLSGLDFLPELVHWNGSQVLVAGLRDLVLISEDAVHWRVEETQVGYYHLFREIAWTGSGYVALGQTSIDYGQSQILISPDGWNWEVSLQSIDVELYFDRLEYGNGQSVILAGTSSVQAVMLSEDDGATWTIHHAPRPNGLRDMYFDGQEFVIIDYYGDILTSPDGFDWSPPIELGLEYIPTAVRRLGEKYLVLGDSGMFGLADDAGNWTSFVERKFDIGAVDVADLERGGRDIVAVTRSGDIAHWNLESETGEVASVPVRECNQAEYAQDRFYVVCDYPASVYSSVDGGNWDLEFSENASGFRLFGIAGSSEALVAVGTSDFETASVVTRSAAGQWTRIHLPQITSPLYSVIWNGRVFVAGGNGFVTTSPDGLSWHVEEPLENPWLHYERMAQHDGRIVAILQQRIAVSEDNGQSWLTTVIPLSRMVDIIRTKDYFVIIGGRSGHSSIWTSPNGLDWKEETGGWGTAIEETDDGLIGAGRGMSLGEATDISKAPRRVSGRAGP